MVSKTNEKNNFKKLYPIIFQYEGDAQKVYLTGSFCDWVNFYEMEKINNKFIFTLFLQKGIYQYKFKVDSIWKCNSNLPTCSDKNGNINNYINVTGQKMEEINSDFSTSSISDINDNNNSCDNSFEDFNCILNKDEDKIKSAKNLKYNKRLFEEEEEVTNKYTNSYFKKLLPDKNN